VKHTWSVEGGPYVVRELNFGDISMSRGSESGIMFAVYLALTFYTERPLISIQSLSPLRHDS